MKRVLAILSGLLFLCCHLSLAKTVKIEWKKIGNAVTYELKLKQASDPEGQEVLTSDSTRYTGELRPGVYSYQIRGVDPSGQKGHWTDLKLLAVLPESPELKDPADGKKIKLYHSTQDVHFTWSVPELAQEFLFTLLKDGQPFAESYLQTSAHQIDHLPEGNFTWRVQSVLRKDSSHWESKSSQEFNFLILREKLEAPELSSPLGAQMPPEDQLLTLEWNPVEGAEAYEVFVQKKSSLRESQDISSGLLLVHPLQVEKNSGILRLSKEGDYSWAVRALSGMHADKTAEVKGPASFGDFTLDRNVFFKNDRSSIGLSGMASPYTYRFYSPSRNVAGNLSAVSLVLRLSGDHWFSKQWGASWSLQYSRFSVFNQSFSQPELEVGVKYRLKLDSKNRGWSIYPKLAVGLKDYNLIAPIYPFYENYSNFSAFNIYTLGLNLAFEIRKQWARRLSSGLRFQAYLPLHLLGGDSSGNDLNGGISKRNLSLGFNTFYWLNENVGMGLGVFTELKSLSYSAQGSNVQERIFMDATYFMGTLLFRLPETNKKSEALPDPSVQK